MGPAMAIRARPHVTYPLIGILLGFGAPVGAFLIRVIGVAEVRERPLDDLHAHAFFYFYALLGTCVVFAIAGFISGHRADWLRRGREFYHDLAEHDSLTGLYNDRALAERYRRAFERAIATRQPLSMMLIDVDQLKAINDAFGHGAGSQALTHVADALRCSKRAADIAARWGGDEFSILLEGAEAYAAMRVAERIVAHLRKTPMSLDGTPRTVSVTIGICTAVQPEPYADVFAAADRALLAGKARGRDTIEAVSI